MSLAPPTIPNPSSLPLALQADQMTPAAIQDRFIATFQALRPDVSSRPRGLLDTFARCIATEVSQLTPALGRSLNNVFAQTALDATYIFLRAAEQSLSPTPAVATVIPVTFTAPVGTVYPVGTRVSTPLVAALGIPITFATQALATVGGGGTVTVNAACTVPGSVGNVAAGAVQILVDHVAGTSAVTNGAPTTLGIDAQSAQSLLTEYLNFWQNQPTSGNPGEYYDWAFQASPGIGGAVVTRAAGASGAVTGAANNGSGLVRLTVPGWITQPQVGQTIVVSGVQGVAAANGTWVVAAVSGTTVDLAGSAFSGSFTSSPGSLVQLGGSVGLSLLGTDGLPADAAVVSAVSAYITPTLIPGEGNGAIGPTALSIYAAPKVPIAVAVSVHYDPALVPGTLTQTQVNEAIIGIADPISTGAITNATNATPIVLTVPGWTAVPAVGQTIIVQGVLGNTAANGTWKVAAADATHVTLEGSAGNGAFSTSASSSVSPPLAAGGGILGYLASLAFAGSNTDPVQDSLNDVDPARLASVIAATRGVGTYNLSTLTINGGTSTISVNRDQVAVFGSLAVTAY